MNALGVVLVTMYIANVDSRSKKRNPSDKYDMGFLNKNKLSYMVGDDRVTYLIQHGEEASVDIIKEYESEMNNTVYYLYTRLNPRKPQKVYYGSLDSFKYSNYRKKRITIFLVHGYHGSYKTDMNDQLTSAFLKDSDVNVIRVDWSFIAGNLLYRTAQEGTPSAGKMVGKFIIWLVRRGLLAYERLHLVGFSLGAHLVGNAGRVNKGKIARITGLDPAGPRWDNATIRLSRSDAQYVEAIHTNVMVNMVGYGITHPSGHADFYPNGGRKQPICWPFQQVTGCSHHHAWELYASSITYNSFVGYRCNSVKEALNSTCSGPKARMGNADINKRLRGIYRLNTKNTYPYFKVKY